MIQRDSGGRTNIIWIRDNPVVTIFLGMLVKNPLLCVVEVGWTAFPFNPWVGLLHGALHGTEVHAILLCTSSQQHSLELGTIDFQGVKEVL